MSQRRPSRRTFLTGAAIAGAALGIPTVVKAQGPIAMRWQSAWPQRDIFHEYALDVSRRMAYSHYFDGRPPAVPVRKKS